MKLVRTKMREYRNGFPDFMDLMIVCSDAGMSMEAGIERVSKELGLSYPSLSQNLQLVSLELQGRAQPRRFAEIAGRAVEPRRGALVRDVAPAIQGTRHQPVGRVARLLRRNAPQAYVACRGKGPFLAGQDVGAGDGLHPAGGDDDRHYSDHREDDVRRFAASLKLKTWFSGCGKLCENRHLKFNACQLQCFPITTRQTGRTGQGQWFNIGFSCSPRWSRR